MVLPISASAGTQTDILNQVLESVADSVARSAQTPSLDSILKDYQVKDDTMISYQPVLFGLPDVPLSAPISMTKTEGDLINNLTDSQGLAGMYTLNNIKNISNTESKTRYPDLTTLPSQAGTSPRDQSIFQENDGHRDAFRHAFWTAQMTSQFGAEFATQFATAHEGVPGNHSKREAMDLYNNEVGVNIATNNPNASTAELGNLIQQAMTDGELIVIDSKNNLQWSDRVAYGQHGVGVSPPAPGQIPVPAGDANLK